MMKSMLSRMFSRAMDLNKANIISMLEKDAGARFLDLGCDEGTWALELANAIGTKDCCGVDIIEERLKEARRKGIDAKKADLNLGLPYDDSCFDCVHSNQVIEHLHDIDMFVNEMYRVLKEGGYCIISTENLSSWCNIFALLCGWQPFSITNISSRKLGLGNPLALHRKERTELKSWLHLRVMSVRALRELMEAHGFRVEKVAGAGYFPLPSVLGMLDVRHSHFISIKARKVRGRRTA